MCLIAVAWGAFGPGGARGEEGQYESKPAPSQAPAIPPVPVPVEATRLRDGVWRLGGEKHLFVDAMGLETLEGVSFAVNPPRAVQVVLRQEHPWETLNEYSSVVDDGSGTYKLYYLNSTREWGNLALATSTDGVHWTKPTLSVVEFQGSKENNIVLDRGAGGSVYHDPHDPDPARRYKFLCNYGIDDLPNTPTTEGIVIYTSPDGVQWTKHEFNVYPFIQDSQAVLLRDPAIGKYVVFFRGTDEVIGRKVMRGETDDPMKPWPYTPNPHPLVVANHEMPYMSTELPVVMSHDELEPVRTDIYGNQVFLYPWAQRTYLAFPTVYYHYRDGREYLSPEPGNVGVGEVQLAVSRDGLRWTRYRRPAYLKHGWWGDHYTYWPWMYQGMIRRGDRILQYGSLRATGHGAIRFIEGSSEAFGGVTLFEQPADRFAGLEFDYRGGRVVTAPFIFEGARLMLNVDAGATGEGRVALLGANGAPIEGFGLEDCDIINADWPDKTVSWHRGEYDLSALAGRPIRLEMRAHGVRLYAMQFVPNEREPKLQVFPRAGEGG